MPIHPMQTGDVDFAAALTRLIGWGNLGRSNFEAFIEHDPNGCFVAEQDGQRLGICVATPYGQVGFIGDLVVHPDARGQGLGGALLRHAVDYLRSRGVRDVYLDAVQAAVPLYERNGFRKVCRFLRFKFVPPARFDPAVRPMLPADLPAVAALDRQAFGADRSFFLARRRADCPALSKVLIAGGEIAGYIQGRSGADWAFAGPWIAAESAAEPLALLESLAAEIPGIPVTVNTLENNARGLDLLRGLGLSPYETLWHMVNGPGEALGISPLVLAAGGAAKG